MPDDLFMRCKASVRYTVSCPLTRALRSCPPGWHPHIRKIFRAVAEARGTVWNCESKFAQLDLGVELPDDGPEEFTQTLNALVVAADSSCEACGGPGRLHDEYSWWRTLCDGCAREIEALGWWEVRARYLAEGSGGFSEPRALGVHTPSSGQATRPDDGEVAARFRLPVADLRNEVIGRWDACCVAGALGEPLAMLSDALNEECSTVALAPDSEQLQTKLRPFAMVLAMLRQTCADQSRVEAWLRHPQPALIGQSLLAVLLRPGIARAVEQWLTRVWLGEPE